ncbi:MAG: ABC transporter substrate-binding protein [Candidatus Aquicultorales bacterium]
MLKKTIVFFLAGLLLVLAAGCGANKTKESSAEAPKDTATTVRLGFFPNITHSQALVGIAQGKFEKALGKGVQLETKAFNAGPSAIEALFAGQIDATYIGPNPAINGYIKSKGKALRIVAGATSGGAVFVVRKDAGIKSEKDFDGKKFASPQLGNTQDVALRDYLKKQGYELTDKGGTVAVIPTANPDILTLFKKKEIDGAWVPEPWGARLVKEGGGRIFLDERDLWPKGEFVTAHLIVRAEFLEENPGLVEKLLGAHVDLTEWINDNPDEAKKTVNAEIKRLTNKALPEDVLDEGFGRLKVTYDPISSSLVQSADAAFAAGFLKEEPKLDGIYDLTILNKVLEKKGLGKIE